MCTFVCIKEKEKKGKAKRKDKGKREGKGKEAEILNRESFLYQLHLVT